MHSAPRKVLVVDDDPAIRRIVTKILESADYQVAVASDGHEALEYIRRECVHFIITDWDMPTINGAELCRTLRKEELPHYIYIIMLTGSFSLVEGLVCGADDFVSKPVNSSELLARLHAGTRIVDLEARLRLLARYDCLTEAVNRRTFFEIFEKEWHRTSRSRESLSCVIADLDHFKSINDRYGHQAGDRVLRAVAAVLQIQARVPDCVCRYGGEEFCMLLPGANEQGAIQFAERCRLGIENLRFEVPMRGTCVTASFGVAARDAETANPAQLVFMADQALLAAKRMSRNRVTGFSTLAETQCVVLPA
jgi:diguanylate cyclase (GGDEF)-like protein